jgi:hypothetical protein
LELLTLKGKYSVNYSVTATHPAGLRFTGTGKTENEAAAAALASLRAIWSIDSRDVKLSVSGGFMARTSRTAEQAESSTLRSFNMESDTWTLIVWAEGDEQNAIEMNVRPMCGVDIELAASLLNCGLDAVNQCSLGEMDAYGVSLKTEMFKRPKLL